MVNRVRSRGRSAFLVVSLVLAVIVSAGEAISQTTPTLRVAVSGAGVSVEAVDAPLDQVLRKVGEALRARIVIETVLVGDLAKTRVTRTFSDVPAVQAFARLLVGRNYALMQGPAGVDEVRVFVDGTTGYRDLGTAGRAPAPGRRVAAKPAESPADDPAEVGRLRQAALTAPDPSARREAFEELSAMHDSAVLKETLAQALARERDSRVLETVVTLVGQQEDVPPDALRAFVASDRDAATRAMALDHLVTQAGSDPATRTLLRTLATSDSSAEVRDAAQNALESLETTTRSSPTRR